MSVNPSVTEITASVGESGQPSSTTVVRIGRDTKGTARPAQSSDTGLLAQESDCPEAATTLARDIGLMARQVIEPEQSLTLPIHLAMPFDLDAVLSCQPIGERRDQGRDTLVFSCSLDQELHTALLDGRLQLAGVEEIDVLTGVRLSSALTGHLDGRTRTSEKDIWQTANNRLQYHRDMEFD